MTTPSGMVRLETHCAFYNKPIRVVCTPQEAEVRLWFCSFSCLKNFLESDLCPKDWLDYKGDLKFTVAIYDSHGVHLIYHEPP